MRKRESKESIGEISQGLLIKQKKCSKKKSRIVLPETKQKKTKRKTKVKVEIKAEIKHQNHQKKKELKDQSEK